MEGGTSGRRTRLGDMKRGQSELAREEVINKYHHNSNSDDDDEEDLSIFPDTDALLTALQQNTDYFADVSAPFRNRVCLSLCRSLSRSLSSTYSP